MGHLNSLHLPRTAKERKEKLYFQPVLGATVLQELQGCGFFQFLFGVCDSRLVLELILEGEKVLDSNRRRKNNF